MKIAIASLGEDENAQISPVGGRAPYYLIFENGKLVKVIKNPFRIGNGPSCGSSIWGWGGGQIGFGVAQMLIDEGVELVIAGKIGPNMKTALETKNIKWKEMSGTVKEALGE
jgi:predicted Fe-Mo cluster-binding NifX family protein